MGFTEKSFCAVVSEANSDMFVGFSLALVGISACTEATGQCDILTCDSIGFHCLLVFLMFICGRASVLFPLVCVA